MRRLLKEMKWDALLVGILYIVLGIVALVLPETMERLLGYMIGVVLIVGGAVSMISYLLRDAHQNYYHNDFLHGLIGIAGGILVLYRVEIVSSAIAFLLGLMVLISGCSKLQDVIDMKRMEYGNWIVMLIFAVINVVLGILLMSNPFSSAAFLFRLLGIGLIFSGVTDCAITVYFAAKIRKYMDSRSAIDSTYKEVAGSAAGTAPGAGADGMEKPETEGTAEIVSAADDAAGEMGTEDTEGEGTVQ